MDNQNTSKIIKYYIGSHTDRIYLIFAGNMLFLFFAITFNKEGNLSFIQYFFYIALAWLTFVPTIMEVKEMRNCLAYGCTRNDIAKSISFITLKFSAILFLEFISIYFVIALINLSNNYDITAIFLSNLNAFIKIISIFIFILAVVNILSKIGKKDSKAKEKREKIILSVLLYLFIFSSTILKLISDKFYIQNLYDYIQNLGLLSSIILYVVSIFLTYKVNDYIIGKIDF